MVNRSLLVGLSLFAVVTLLALALFGGQDEPGGRPTVKELETALWASTRSEGGEGAQAVVHCQAVALESSDLSDGALRAYTEESSYRMSAEEEALLAEGGGLWQKLRTCQQNR